jgi:hypothetical protein
LLRRNWQAWQLIGHNLHFDKILHTRSCHFGYLSQPEIVAAGNEFVVNGWERLVKKQIWVGIAAVLALSAAANAAVAWSTPAGNLGSYSYDSGQSVNGKFGDGAASTSGFVLAPNQFVANANGTNTPVTTTDTASVVVHAGNSNVGFVMVTVSFAGDYTILGAGSVDATGSLKVTDLDTLATITTPLVVGGVPVSTVTNAGGSFTGSATQLIPAIPSMGQNLKLEFTGTLTATAGSNGTSLIEIKDADIAVFMLPEPTSLAALSVAGTLLARRLRK